MWQEWWRGKARTEQLLELVDWASAFRRYLIVCHLVLACAFVLWVDYTEFDAHMHEQLLPYGDIFYENVYICNMYMRKWNDILIGTSVNLD